MLAIAAAIIFAIAFLLNATSTATDVVFSFTSLLLAGLTCLALHQAASARAGQCPAAGAADNAGSYRRHLRVPERLRGARECPERKEGPVQDGSLMATLSRWYSWFPARDERAAKALGAWHAAWPRQLRPAGGMTWRRHGNGHAADAADGRGSQDGGDRAAACRQAPSGRGQGTTSSQRTLTDETAAWPWGPLA
jgi:hypothetical protein